MSRGDPSRLSRRTFIAAGGRLLGAAAIGGGASALLAACGGSTGTASPASKAAGPPRRGGQLRVGLSNETDGVNPLGSQLTSSGMYYARAVFDPLAVLAADGSVRPYLARAITPNATYDQWSISLRPGVMFHDGTPADADALLYFLQTLVSSPLLSTSVQGMISDVSKVDALTVKLTMKGPWVAFPAYLTGGVSSQMGYLAAPSMLKAADGASHPVGTGPFVFRQWEPDSHFTVERNPHYWRPGLPYLDGITFRPVPDDTARSNSLLAGDLDLIQQSSAAEIASLRRNSSLNVIDDVDGTVGEPLQNFIQLNTQVAPLDDLRVRQALAHATDQRKVIRLTVAGLIEPSNGPFEPKDPEYGPTGYPSYDLSRARALVADYTREKGPVAFPLSTQTNSTYVTQCQLLQQMWKDAGINVTTIDTLENTTYISHVIVGNFSAGPWQQFGVADPDLNYPFWSGREVTPTGKFSTNFARNSDPRIDAALETGRTNPDPAARHAAYREVAQRFGADIPYVWLGRQIWAVAAGASVHGFQSMSLPDGATAAPLNQGDAWLTGAWRS